MEIRDPKNSNKNPVAERAVQELRIELQKRNTGSGNCQIAIESGVLDLLQAGDNFMVDRGFEISAVVPYGVNMPPFFDRP